MKKARIFVVLFILGFLLFYNALPVIRFGFYGFAVIILVLFLIYYFSLIRLKADKTGKKFIVTNKPSKVINIFLLLFFSYIIIIPVLTSATIFHTSSYQKMIGEVQNGEKISRHIEPISIDKLRVVDQSLAYLLGEKIIGSQPALGSQIDLGEFSIQKVNNELYWVAPLLHSGFFKWFNNKEGTPGYVMVSATNERDVKLVQTVNNQPIKSNINPMLISKVTFIDMFISTDTLQKD